MHNLPRDLPLIYFCRHGQTEWNRIGRIQGSADTDINAEGRRQAAANGAKLKALIGGGEGFCFAASPLRRTRETMERIRAAMGLAPQDYRADEALRELCFGDWQGSTLAEIAQSRPRDYEARRRGKWQYLPAGAGAESYEMLAARSRRWLESAKQKTVCVTHGGWLRSLFYHCGLPPAEAAELVIPQDKALRLENGRLDWL